MQGTELDILVVNINLLIIFPNTFTCTVCTGQSPAIPPPSPRVQASRPTLATPVLEGKYFVLFFIQRPLL